MADRINITLPEVEECSHVMRSLNSQLDDVLSRISNDMNALQAVWQSSGAETIINRFHHFSKRFLQESETIEEYCRFLDFTVQTYQSLESTITSNAETFNQ